MTLAQAKYSLWFGKRSRLGQRHDLQNITLTSLFYKNIYRKVIYVYFYENDFQNKSIDMIFHISKINGLKVIHHLYSQCLTQILSKMTSFTKPEGVPSKDVDRILRIMVIFGC
jgi:hypothetical protein